MAFTFDYPEDDSVKHHTLPNIPIGWRWDEPFAADILDFARLSYFRYADKTVSELCDLNKIQIDVGYLAMVANNRILEGISWASCWKIVFEYRENGILVMHNGGEVTEENHRSYEDIILITGVAECKQTYRDILNRIYSVLIDPSHDTLKQDIMNDLSNVTTDNAASLPYKMMGINSVPTEAKWHAEKAFVSADNLLSPLISNEGMKSKLSDLFFSRYIADHNNETHGIGCKLWNCLNIGPHTGYMPTEESFALIQKPEIQAELKRMFRIMFDNDRAAAKGIKECLEK